MMRSRHEWKIYLSSGITGNKSDLCLIDKADDLEVVFGVEPLSAGDCPGGNDACAMTG